MATDLNKVFMIGRLTKDPDLKYTQGGTSIASFSMANNKTYMQNNEKKEQVSFFNCIAWGKTGEIIAQYVKKGHKLAIEGRLQQRSWQDQSGAKRSTVEIIVETFQFLNNKNESQTNAPPDENSVPADNHFSDDDIPF